MYHKYLFTWRRLVRLSLVGSNPANSPEPFVSTPIYIYQVTTLKRSAWDADPFLGIFSVSSLINFVSNFVSTFSNMLRQQYRHHVCLM